MNKICYLDDNIALGQCYASRNYSDLKEKILSQPYTKENYVLMDGERFGFEITPNIPLTKLYQFPCYVVKFVFSSVQTLHDEQQETIMRQVAEKLADCMNREKGYYDIRIPTHIVDLIKAINYECGNLLLCGGTVEEIHVGKVVPPVLQEGMRLFFAEKTFVEKNRKKLEQLAYDSFKSYQGQYHISPVTDKKAGEIYSSWIASYFDSFSPNTVLIAEYKGEIVGYCTIRETEQAVDAVLSSVDASKRQLGTYKAMISTLIAYAKKREKLFVTSTQFDNYIVQGTWNSLGLRPFYSIYNMHYDNR